MRLGKRDRMWIAAWAALGAFAVLGPVGLLAEAIAQEAAPAQPGAETAAPKGNADRGAVVYRSSCAMCHKDPKTFAKRFSGKDPRVRGVTLEDFVTKHHGPQTGPKRDLVAYLKAL